MSLRYRVTYAPTGNGIVERNHRTVKVITTRNHCSIPEAVHLYNVMSCDRKTMTEAPASGVYSYEVQDCIQQTQEQHPCDTVPGDERGDAYSEGDPVWIRNRGECCTSTSQPRVVTRVISLQVVEVDDVLWHVRDMRHRIPAPPDGSSRPDTHEV